MYRLCMAISCGARCVFLVRWGEGRGKVSYAEDIEAKGTKCIAAGNGADGE